jgi:hypothetical protein
MFFVPIQESLDPLLAGPVVLEPVVCKGFLTNCWIFEDFKGAVK